MEFNEVLRKLRKSRSLSQAALSEKLGVSKSLVGSYETGERKPSYEALENIADYFNVTIDYLMGKEDGSVYYLNPEAAEMAQFMYDRPEMKVLFDASRKASKEDIETVADLLKKLSEK